MNTYHASFINKYCISIAYSQARVVIPSFSFSQYDNFFKILLGVIRIGRIYFVSLKVTNNYYACLRIIISEHCILSLDFVARFSISS